MARVKAALRHQPGHAGQEARSKRHAALNTAALLPFTFVLEPGVRLSAELSAELLNEAFAYLSRDPLYAWAVSASNSRAGKPAGLVVQRLLNTPSEALACYVSLMQGPGKQLGIEQAGEQDAAELGHEQQEVDDARALVAWANAGRSSSSMQQARIHGQQAVAASLSEADALIAFAQAAH